MHHTKKISTITTIAPYGFEGIPVQTEVDIRAGLPSLQIVGMGNKAVDEARHRVRGAILNSGLQFPAKKLVINLSPAELPKHGTSFDLAIAIGILESSGQLRASQTANSVFFGELSLHGNIIATRGVTVATEAAKLHGASVIFVPAENRAQAALIHGITIIGATSLKEVFQRLRGVFNGAGSGNEQPPTPPPPHASAPLFTSIAGQEAAKRALCIAIAGRHNILLYGPPGTGKTQLAKAAASLLPPLSDQEIIDTTKLANLAGSTHHTMTHPPFRAPHHTVTKSALVGGGLTPRPGEVSLAHKGILFLDELPEYPRPIIEALRQPLEDRSITLTRIHGTITYPADCLLIATMNPCPCGYYGDPVKSCTCTSWQISSYTKKLSGPLLDRIDLFVPVMRNQSEYLFDSNTLQKEQHIPEVKMIKRIRKLQKGRYSSSNYYNGNASHEDILKLFLVDDAAHTLVRQAQDSLHLSGRVIIKTLRVARTIADAENSPTVHTQHVAEALQFRSLTRA